MSAGEREALAWCLEKARRAHGPGHHCDYRAALQAVHAKAQQVLAQRPAPAAPDAGEVETITAEQARHRLMEVAHAAHERGQHSIGLNIADVLMRFPALRARSEEAGTTVRDAFVEGYFAAAADMGRNIGFSNIRRGAWADEAEAAFQEWRSAPPAEEGGKP